MSVVILRIKHLQLTTVGHAHGAKQIEKLLSFFFYREWKKLVFLIPKERETETETERDRERQRVRETEAPAHIPRFISR